MTRSFLSIISKAFVKGVEAPCSSDLEQAGQGNMQLVHRKKTRRSSSFRLTSKLTITLRPPAPRRGAHSGSPPARCRARLRRARVRARPCAGGTRSQVHRLPAVGHGSGVPMSVPARAPEGRAPRGPPHRPPSAPRGAVQCPPHARWHPGIVMHCPTTPIHGDHGNILHCRTLQRDPVDVT